MGIDTEAIKDAAKERVEKDLAELNEKIVKLVAFLYGAEPLKITHTAKRLLVEQLSVMQQYSDILTRRTNAPLHIILASRPKNAGNIGQGGLRA